MPENSLFVSTNGVRIEIGIQDKVAISMHPLDAIWLVEQLVAALRFMTEEPEEQPISYKELN